MTDPKLETTQEMEVYATTRVGELIEDYCKKERRALRRETLNNDAMDMDDGPSDRNKPMGRDQGVRYKEEDEGYGGDELDELIDRSTLIGSLKVCVFFFFS